MEAQFSTVDVTVTSATVGRRWSRSAAGIAHQSYSIKVNYAPASAVQSITFSRAGITSSLTPTLREQSEQAGSISLLDTINEATD